MTTNDINAIRKLAAAADDGPWTAHPDGLVWSELIGDPVSGSVLVENAEFIAAARTVVPALCDEILRLREQLFAQRPVIEAAQAWAELHEESDVRLIRRRSSAPAVADLYDAVEQYRLMDLALTSARDEAVVRAQLNGGSK